MKNAIWKKSLFWGLVLILAAVVLILEGSGIVLPGGINLWRILGGVILVAIIIERLIRVRIADVIFPLAFLLLLFEAPLAQALGKGDDLISNWTVLLAALLLTIGANILVSRSGGKVQGHLGNATLYFDAADLKDRQIRDQLGRTLVYFTNKEAYDDCGVISISNNVGQIVLYVPREWNVVTTGGENLGRVNIPPQTGTGDKSITLSISDNLGVVDVIFS